MLLGLLLLVAAALKGHELATGPVVAGGLTGSRPVLIALVEFELAFGLWLLVGLEPQWTWRAAIVLFAAFACVSLYKALSGQATCGCFGRVKVGPWWTLALDTLAVAALLRWRPAAQGQVSAAVASPRRPGALWTRPAGVVAVALGVGVPSAAVMASYRPAILSADGVVAGGGRLVVLEPDKCIGKPLPLMDYIDIGPQLRYGNWLVVIYHDDCPKCQELLPRYADMATASAGQPDERRVALVELPPYGSTFGGPLYRHCKFGQLSDEWEWFVTTPSVIVLDRGCVVEVVTDLGDMAVVSVLGGSVLGGGNVEAIRAGNVPVTASVRFKGTISPCDRG